jgi:hypothetical protein
MNDQSNEIKLRILQASQSQDAPRAEDHEHDDHDVATVEQEHRLDLADVREKLRHKTGKQYWRTLEELTSRTSRSFCIANFRVMPRNGTTPSIAVIL